MCPLYLFEQVGEQNLIFQRISMMKVVWNSNVLYVKFQKSWKKIVWILEFQEHLPRKYGIHWQLVGQKVWNSGVL